MIRVATAADIDQIVELAREAHSAAGGDLVVEFDPDAVREWIGSALNDRVRVCLFVTEQVDGAVEGFLCGGILPAPDVREKFTAAMFQVYTSLVASPDAEAQLVDRFIEWAAAEPNVIKLRLWADNARSDWRRLKPIFERHGAHLEGVTYAISKPPKPLRRLPPIVGGTTTIQ